MDSIRQLEYTVDLPKKIFRLQSTFWKAPGKNALSGAIAGLVLAFVTKGVTLMFPKLK
ncbi:MAG: hypothetical protein ACPL1H_00125 [bacterium]